MAQLPPPSGLTIRYQGAQGLGTSQFWYWIQAVYVEGISILAGPVTTGAVCPGSFTQNNFVSFQWNPAPGAIGYIVWRTTTSSPPTQGTNELFIATSETGVKDDGSLALFSGAARVDSMYVWRAIYNFAVDGGAVSTLVPSVSDTIPNNAIMIGGTINSTTAVTSLGAATVAVGTSAGSSSTSILTATGKASFTLDAMLNVVPVIATPVKMTAAGQINITIAAAALTAGVIEVFVFGYVATN